MKKIITICCLCILQVGCTTTVNTDGVEGVIFPASKADFVAFESGRKDLQYWTPTKSDITAAMPRIKEFLVKQAPTIANKLQKYRCQYFGIVVEGKKIIYCNFFYRDGFFQRGGHDKAWQTKPVFVFDGGDWYFQLEYDTESKQCINFQVNGEA